MIYVPWGNGWKLTDYGEGLSILDLIDLRTIDSRLTGLLWLLIEERTSILVAAGPSFVGKSTLMHAMLDFVRPEVQQVFLRGFEENFKFVNHTKPESTYLITEEISNHQWDYLWGYQVVRAFELLPRGYSMVGTIHARTAEQVVYILHAVLGVPLQFLSRPIVVVTLEVARSRNHPEEIDRRVGAVSVISLVKEGIEIQSLASRRPADEGFEYLDESDLQSVFRLKFRLGQRQFIREITARQDFLNHLLAKDIRLRDDLRKEFHRFQERAESSKGEIKKA